MLGLGLILALCKYDRLESEADERRLTVVGSTVTVIRVYINLPFVCLYGNQHFYKLKKSVCTPSRCTFRCGLFRTSHRVIVTS